MKKGIVAMLLTLALLGVCAGACAAGVTLRVFTPFADVDFAAQSYMDMITAWETETGNLVEDYSGLQDESWLDQMNRMVASGEADILVVPAGSPLSGTQVLTAQELTQALGGTTARQFASMRGQDGSVLLVPLRLNWEALYVNTDVLARYGLNVPTTYDELITACAVLSQNGVVAISNALCEWAEITLDCVALAGASEAEYGLQTSLEGAQEILTALTQVGAFGADAWNVTDAEAERRFLDGEAAMRIDADWLAESVAQERWDSVVVTNVPAPDGQARTLVVGTPCFGLTITRACWEDDARCEAALSLAGTLLQEENAAKLGAAPSGRLGESIAALTLTATDCTGVLYDLNAQTFEAWSESVIAGLMSLQ